MGPGEWGGYSDEVSGAPSSGKVTMYLQGSNTVVLPSTPDLRDFVRLSNRYCPQAYSTAVSHPTSTSRLWIVGIMSVGTESVGIEWCTRRCQVYSSPCDVLKHRFKSCLFAQVLIYPPVSSGIGEGAQSTWGKTFLPGNICMKN